LPEVTTETAVVHSTDSCSVRFINNTTDVRCTQHSDDIRTANDNHFW